MSENKVHCNTCNATLETNLKPSKCGWARVDAYGLFTGIYCQACYNSNKYPYRKDAYYDPSYAGERMEED